MERRPESGPSTRSPTEDETALRDWLATPPAPARVESEAQLRLLYANYGSKDDLLATIQSIEDDAQSTIDHYAQLVTEYARGDGLFPDRIHVNALLGSLSIEQARATVRWAQRSRGAVQAWETTETPDIEWAVKTMLHAARDPHDDYAASPRTSVSCRASPAPAAPRPRDEAAGAA